MSAGLRTPSSIAIVGGGISGLAAAHYLAIEGHEITLFESSDQLGGLGTFFQHRDYWIDRFYHCLLPSDEHLLHLIRSLNFESEIYWKPSAFAYLSKGKLFPLNTAVELLRFAPLSFVDRIRVGITGLYGSLVSSKGLDDVTAQHWLTRLSGARAFRTFWQPLLEAKFGDRFAQVPALWFWRRFNREKGKQKEIKGYIRGGYKKLIERLEHDLTTRGVKIIKSSPIESVSIDSANRVRVRTAAGETAFDKVLLTVPSVQIKKIAGEQSWASAVRDDIDYQGVVNVVLVLKKSIADCYWIATVDSDVPFQGIVETTRLRDPEEIGGRHLVYLMNYVHRSHALFLRPDAEILTEYTAALRRVMPELKEGDIEAGYVFKAPFVEPIYTLGFSKKMPPDELLKERIFLASTSQVYPEVTSWNGSVGVARRVVDKMAAEPKAIV